MKKKNNNITSSSKKRAIITSIGIAITTAFLAVFLALFIGFKSTADSDGLKTAFIDYKSFYAGNQTPIKSSNENASINTSYISMTEANDSPSVSYADKIITINSAEELYAFSYACYNHSSFLAYDYLLLCNIDCDSYQGNKFIPIGWSTTSENSFTGTFDGNGYDIYNLDFIVINSESASNQYKGMKYFAMFAENNGEIKNFGLVEPTITLAYMIETMADYGVANICGLNKGKISGVYVKQLSQTLIDECGITAAGGYRVSGFVLENTSTGEISDSYFATNSVYNYTIVDVVEFADIALTNEGSISDTYFYNTSINFNLSTFVDGGSYTLVFADDLGAKSKSGSGYPGTMVSSLDELNSKFVSDAYWSVKSSDSSKLEYYYNYQTPVRRVFSEATSVTTGLNSDGEVVVSSAAIKINNVKDFLFMYELMNVNAFFASSKTHYTITKDINLKGIPGTAYAYNHGIGASFVGQEITNGSVTMVDNGKTKYPTIYNADILNDDKKVVTTGLNAYGLFSYLTGTVKNLNVVSSINLNDIKESTNAKAIGVLAGYIEGGIIENVNTYIDASNTTASKLGEYYLGGLCGVFGGEGSIKNCVTTGKINLVADSTYQVAAGYMAGIAVGGLVGYIEDSLGDLNTVLSAVNITSELGSNAAYAIGGICGAAYTRLATKLENLGTINIGTTSKAPTYNKLYVAGILGRHLGEAGETSETAEVNNFTNQGNINVYGNSTATLTMIAGIENADIQTITTSSGNVTPSLFVDKANNILFYASAMTNRANIMALYNTETNILGTNGYLTNGINICSGNGFDSRLSSIYNLDNNYVFDTTTRKLKSINASTQDISVIGNYAGVVNVYNGTDTTGDNIVNLHTVYNLRSINFTMGQALTFDGIYSGTVNGKYVNYYDVRNEGELTFELNKASAAKHNLYINGVFDELSLGSEARAIYNGGDITITDSATEDMSINIYVSGICRNNLAVITDANQNPLNSTFDSDLVGSLNDAINNGKITVTSSDYNKTKLYATKTGNGNVPEAATQSSTTNLNGSVYAAGIANTNSGIISNAFNLGDIQLDIFAKTANSQYYAAGIACVMTGDYAQIRDSANNGNIQVINMCNSVNSFVLVGGIFANNTPSSKNNNINEVVSFTINYGTLIAFNAYLIENNKTANFGKFTSFVGGISAKGICNIVNVLNYGNIYGSEVAGSIVGGFDLSKYNATNIYLANTINYANIYAITKNSYSGSTLIHACYNDISGTPTFTGTGDYNPTRGEYYYLGSMFGFIDFNNQTNIVVRYAINFFNGAYICQEVNQLNIPTDGIDSSTFITVNGSLDKFGGSFVKYAPLSTITDTETGNIGVFSEDFIFRRAINGDPTAVNYAKYVTDAYIADFFQFVRFDKVNEVLLERIGWKNIAYINAAEQLARDVKTMSVFVSDGYAGLTKTTTSVSPSFESSTWYENIDSTLLTNFLTEVLSNNDGNSTEFTSSDLKEILEYILFDEECISDITTTIRASIIDTIMSYYEKEQKDAYELLQTLLYDELLAKVVSGESSDYTAVQTKIRTILSTASNSELESVLTSYLELLIEDTENKILDPLFNKKTGDYYLVKKMELIQILLADYSADTLSVIAEELLESSETTNNVLKYINYLTGHTDIATNIYANLFAYNDSNNSYYLSAINEALKKYDVSSILEESSFNTNNIVDRYDDVTETYSWINGTKWYYEKDYTELWNLVKNNADFQNYLSTQYFSNHKDPTSSNNYSSIIAKATEYNNTYQTNDGPSEIVEEDTKISGIQLYAGENKNSIKIGSYDKRNGGIYRNSNGDTANNPWQEGVGGKDQVIKNRFIYTPDAVNSYATYYYGPYMANGEVFSENWNTTYTYLGYDLYNASSAAAKVYVPTFISTNRTITENAIASSNTTDPNKSISPFYWNNYNKENSRYQWVSNYICDKSSDDSTNYLYKNYKTSPEGWIVDYYDFTPGKEYTCNKDAKQENTTITYGENNVTLTLSSTRAQTFANLAENSGKQTHPLRDYYLTGYATSSMITGIWFVHSVWYDKGIKGTFLMSKETYLRSGGYDNPITSDFNYYQGLQTTQYTYYQMKDLVKLDGIQTKGKRDGRDDNDEIGIISALMTKILSTKAGEKIVINALAEYAKNHDFTSSEADSFTYLTSALRGTSFATNSVTNVFTKQSNTALESIIYDNTKSLKDYLDSLIGGVTYTDLQNLSMLGATDKELFKKILLLTLNNEQYDNDSGTNTVTNTDITYFIYKYADYLRSINPDITDEEIAAMFAGVEASDLTALTQLSMLDWDSFITTIGGDADASQQDGIGSYTDIKALYESLGSKDGATIAKGYAYPFKIADDTLLSPSASKINMTLSAGTKQVTACYTYEASSTGNNIGYYIGSDVKVYNKANKANFDTFYYPNGDGTPYTLPTAGHAAPSEDIVSYLSDTQTDGNTTYRNGDYLIRLTGDSQFDANNEGGLVAVENACVGTWSGTLLVPNRCIWVAPIKSGTFKFVLSNIENTGKMGFRLYKLTRSTPGNYSTYFTNYSQALECNMQLQPGKSYYYEIDITDEDIAAGYEYAISSGDGYMPYITYIDIGASGTDSTKVKYPDLSDIEERYDTYYASTSDYASYLIDTNLVKSYSTTKTTITVDEPTIILIKAATGGTVTVTGQTTYDVDGTATTIGTVKKNTTGGYRAYYLSGGTYTISATDTTIEEILTVKQKSKITYDTGGSTIYYDNDTSDATKKIIFTGTNYTNLSSFNLNIDLSNKILETLLVVYPSMIDSNKKYYFFDDATIEEFTSAQLKEIIKLLAKADYKNSNSALGRLITNLKDSYYDDLLLTINNSDVIYNMITKIINVCDENDYSETEDLIIAAYLGDNFLECADNNLMTQSILYTLLQTYKATAETSVVDGDTTEGYYNFIINDTTIDATKFNYFLKHLGVSANLEGYGIFALASSHGIKNGTFIPDNLTLTSMDAAYNTIAKDSNNDSIIELLDSSINSSDAVTTGSISTSWRDNTGASSKATDTTQSYDTSDSSSVNYAFRIEMKQLKLSISTTIFELDLTDSTVGTIYATSSTIDVDHGTITYYVLETYLDTLKANNAISIKYIDYAETATFRTNKSNTTSINLTNGITNSQGNYQVVDAITVTAEDTTVYTAYDIILVGIPVDFTVTSDKTSLGYQGGTVTLTITCANIPNTFDFKPFFSIINNSVKQTEGWSFNASTRNNGIVSNGTAKLVIDIDKTLPGGTEELTISVFSTTKVIEVSKELNTEAKITKFTFEDNDLTTGGAYVTKQISEIKFGRAYDYSELTDYTSDNFYLAEFEISANAKVSITASYQNLAANDGRIRYTVTYLVTSESGETKEYIHYLDEMNYFDGVYANLFEEGIALQETDLYKENFTFGTDSYLGQYSSLTYSNVDTFVAATFSRGFAPEYRIKYILTNFYTLGDVTYKTTEETLNNGCALTLTYAGLTLTVGDSNEPGVYKFDYIYTSKGTWDKGVLYERTYQFPTLFIYKGYSRDALLNRLTFLDQSVIIGNTASVMKTNTAESTSILPEAATSAIDGHEITYNDIFKSSTREIEIKNKTIKYSDAAKSTTITDYYALGTVSDANLNYYAPTFGIEEHAQIYQYTTYSKLTGYGDKQELSDAQILTNHDNMYLYVPFTNGTEEIIYLVQISSTGVWTNVYPATYDGTDEKIGQFASGVTTLIATTYANKVEAGTATAAEKALITVNGYYVSNSAGSIESNALYMNYVGSPKENHFWYVSYVVFSEAALHGITDQGCQRYYHISIVDATNTIYFEVELYAPVDFASELANQDLYMTISENIYVDTTKTATRQISGYLVANTDKDGNLVTDTDQKSHTYGLVLYTLRINLQTLPKGYFYFYIDLPNGYVVTATTDMANQLDKSSDKITSAVEAGAFLPFSSIITKTVALEFIVKEGTGDDATAWAVTTSDIYTRKATYLGTTPVDTTTTNNESEETSGE